MGLRLYRRHISKCSKAYAQNERTFEPRTRREQNQDCDCPIVASGSLRLEAKRILHLSTERNRWDDAKEIAGRWEKWQALTDPSPLDAESPVSISFDEAAKKFLENLGPSGKNVTQGVIQQYRVMFYARMQPFLASRRTNFLAAFDSPAFTRECFLSFKNVNPHRNRKCDSIPEQPLSDGTKRAELERFRAFLRFCVESGWLKNNHAAKVKLGTLKPNKKYGLLPQEERQVFAAIERATARGRLSYCKELRALCLVMRHSGLRISDAVMLNDSQLVPRTNGKGYAIEIESQEKTNEWVRVPITAETAEALLALPFKGTKDGKRYWFYTGNGASDTAVNNWRNRLVRLFHSAQDPDSSTGELQKPFEHHASPHTWRHTFAISHLNAGADIKMVSRWLGHSSITITEMHYGHANRATHIASEQAYDESIRRQKSRASSRIDSVAVLPSFRTLAVVSK